jgi:hypothetical protein
MRPEGLTHRKIPVTPSGIVGFTFAGDVKVALKALRIARRYKNYANEPQ